MQATTDRYVYQQYVNAMGDPFAITVPIQRWVVALPPGPTTDWSPTSADNRWQYGAYKGRAYRRAPALVTEKV